MTPLPLVSQGGTGEGGTLNFFPRRFLDKRSD